MANEVKSADTIFKEFKEHSIAEFFKKNRQMLGYSGMVRSLVTVVHELVTNGLDACEEANILPEIEVSVREAGENRYKVRVKDNGPGIPKKFIGKTLATMLAGTKFHRYVQQRGQQGIGAAGVTLFAQVTTGKPLLVESSTGKEPFTCKVAVDTAKNSAIITDYNDLLNQNFTGLMLEGEFADVKYENSEHGVYEYLKRTALSNPHAQIKFIDPTGKESVFMRAVNAMPEKSRATKPHPMGLSVNDLLEFSHVSQSRKLSSFFVDTYARVTSNKVNELKAIATSVDFEMQPKELDWPNAEELIKAIKQVKWISPDASSIIPIGRDQVQIAIKNILNPDFMSVVERRPRVFRGGVPFVIEAAVAYGGNAGYPSDNGASGTVLRFANRVPLLFDAGNCAITDAVRDIDWKRYNIDMDSQPVSVFVNISSVFVPYAGVGKEAVSKEDEIIDEIKLAVMEAARGVQGFIRGKEHVAFEANRYKATMRYVKQLSADLGDLTGADKQALEKELEAIVAKHYPKFTQAKADMAAETAEGKAAQKKKGKGDGEEDGEGEEGA